MNSSACGAIYLFATFFSPFHLKEYKEGKQQKKRKKNAFKVGIWAR